MAHLCGKGKWRKDCTCPFCRSMVELMASADALADEMMKTLPDRRGAA
jgi:hypothetical protein